MTASSTGESKSRADLHTRQDTGPTALDMLAADHATIERLFTQCGGTTEGPQRKALVDQACVALSVHAQLEEELFYPALRDALPGRALLDDAEVEHGSIRQMVMALQASEPGNRLYDANVRVIAAYVKHHVRKEEETIFPGALRASGLDLVRMGQEMRMRRRQLLEELGLGLEREDDSLPRDERYSTTSRHI